VRSDPEIGAHASGYALRFPRIKRIRWDKRRRMPIACRACGDLREHHNFGAPHDEPRRLRPEPTLFDGLL
jgi:hypothetical protein